ncbi:MAG TPA: polymer-forming cytoskeletal protein [Thermomicrobiales bacterium]|nr:polymer-forming cytoskeletal protein [Thermomicrobiales bacterium]
MVFRRESNKVDSFQRQMNALRQQIGDEEQDDEFFDPEASRRTQSADRGRRPAGDEGYSFGNVPAASSADQNELDMDDVPAIPEMPQVDQQVSVIAAGTTWQGDLEAQGSIHVHGRVNGSLKASEDVWIADGAEVDARIEADRVIIGGDVSGQVTARSRFEALPECDVQADVDAPTFVVHEGATLNGALSMSRASGGDSNVHESRSRPGSIIQRRGRASS